MKTSRSERTNLRKLPEVDKRNKESQNGPTVPDGVESNKRRFLKQATTYFHNNKFEFGSKMQNNVHAENQFKHEIKTSRLEDYHHPMSKWIHIAYSSPKPRSSRMYQQLITNFNKITKEENKKPSKKVVEKEVPFQVACEKHAHLLSCQRFRNFDSLQERMSLRTAGPSGLSKMSRMKDSKMSRGSIQSQHTCDPYNHEGTLRENNTIHSNKSIERQGTISQDVFNDKSTRIDLSPTSSVIHKFNFQKLIRVVYNSVLASTVGESIINMQDNQGKTVLHYACQKQNKQMVRMLLDYGAWVGAKDNQDKEPLAYYEKSIIQLNQDSMFDSKFGFYETCTVDQILKCINKSESKNLNLFEMLFKENDIFHESCQCNLSPIYHAIKQENIQALSFLLHGDTEMYKDIIKDNTDSTEVINKHHKTLTQIFQDSPWTKYCINSIFESCDNEGNTPLHIASIVGNINIFKYLFKTLIIAFEGMNQGIRIKIIEATNKEKYTPFLLSVKNSNHEIIEYLITDCFCTAICRNSDFQNPLHLAVLNKDIKTICLLLCMDAEQAFLMSEKDKNHNTPLDIADKICSILLKACEFKDVCIPNSAILPNSPNNLPKIETFRNSIRLPLGTLEMYKERSTEDKSSLIKKASKHKHRESHRSTKQMASLLTVAAAEEVKSNNSKINDRDQSRSPQKFGFSERHGSFVDNTSRNSKDNDMKPF